VADGASIKFAFHIAFQGMCAASDFDIFESHFGHALGDFYRLYELAGQPPRSETSRNTALGASPDGELALAVAWSRKFRTHDLLEVTESGDVFTDYVTELFGTLVWRDSSFISSALASPARKKAPTKSDQERLGYYTARLAGQPVLDTLQRGVGALLAII
jgi:hypothetical protein